MPISVIASGNQQINLPHFPWQPAVQCSEAPAVATIRGRPGGGTVSPHQSCRQTQRERSGKISLPPPADIRRREKEEASPPLLPQTGRQSFIQPQRERSAKVSLPPPAKGGGGRRMPLLPQTGRTVRNTPPERQNIAPSFPVEGRRGAGIYALTSTPTSNSKTISKYWRQILSNNGIPPHTCGIPPHT